MTDTERDTRTTDLTTDQVAGVTARDTDAGQDAGSGDVRPAEAEVDRNWDRPTVDHDNAPQPTVHLLAADELQAMLEQWRQIQGEFVDEPRQAIHDADALVADLMQRLARTFAEERDQLEAQLSDGGEVSTEDLRQGLRRYRSFFERLLAA